MSAKDVRQFTKTLEALGATVEPKPSKFGSGWNVYVGGRRVGSFDANVDKGKRQKNILAQVKRAIGA